MKLKKLVCLGFNGGELEEEHDYRLHAQIIDEVNQTLGEFLTKYE